MKITKENLENVKNSFQKFYDYELQENDTREILENLLGVSEILQKSLKHNNNKY